MIDAPGSWSTGSFTLVEGYSLLDNEQAVISEAPFAATWIPTREDRTPLVRLRANPNYWDKARGPHLAEIVFRNDLSQADALNLVCTTEGEVDIVTNVAPGEAARVEQSTHAKLVTIAAMRAIVGVINRDAAGLPLHDRRARQALNLAIDRAQLVAEGMFGYADPLAGLTPPSSVTMLHRLSPYTHDAAQAAQLWQAALQDTASSRTARSLRLATTPRLVPLARIVADNVTVALGLAVEITTWSEAEQLETLRRLAEKKAPPEWDVFVYAWSGQATDAPPLGLHRGFVGADGELRAGPVLPEFEAMYDELRRETNPLLQSQIAYRIDKFVYEEALALFLCAPHALYAVNKQVKFTPYATTFELAESSVGAEHWSQRR